jgi:hypothetical protein
VACQRQHWTSHKRQCPVFAQDEFLSTFGSCGKNWLIEVLDTGLDPAPSDLALLPKLSALTWTARLQHGHLDVVSLNTRVTYMSGGRPAPGDTRETLIRLLKRAVTDLSWPELPDGTRRVLGTYMKALAKIADLGEPEAAIEIFSRHVEDVERHVVAPNYVAKCLICRLEWLLVAADKFEKDEERRSAYLAETKGLMKRATRSLQGLQSQEWDRPVSEARGPLRLGLRSVWLTVHPSECDSCARVASGLSKVVIIWIYSLRSSPSLESF